MKIKTVLIAINIILLTLSVSQIFSIPPFAGDVFSVYKSGYFTELDRQFSVIRDSFLAIKTYGNPKAAWVFLSDIEKDQGISVQVVNRKGLRVLSPGYYGDKADSAILKSLDRNSSENVTGISSGRYFSIMPVSADKKCLICHDRLKDKDIAGIMKFERKFNSHIYYTSERIIIFIVISALLFALLIVIIKWDPEKQIKELFDK